MEFLPSSPFPLLPLIITHYAHCSAYITHYGLYSMHYAVCKTIVCTLCVLCTLHYAKCIMICITYTCIVWDVIYSEISKFTRFPFEKWAQHFVAGATRPIWKIYIKNIKMFDRKILNRFVQIASAPLRELFEIMVIQDCWKPWRYELTFCRPFVA